MELVDAQPKPGTALKTIIEESQYLKEFMLMIREKLDLEGRYLNDLKKLRKTCNPQWSESGIRDLVSPILDLFENEIAHLEARRLENGASALALGLPESLEAVYKAHQKAHRELVEEKSLDTLKRWYAVGEPYSFILPEKERRYRWAVVNQQRVVEHLGNWYSTGVQAALDVHQERAEDMKKFLIRMATERKDVVFSHARRSDDANSIYGKHPGDGWRGLIKLSLALATQRRPSFRFLNSNRRYFMGPKPKARTRGQGSSTFSPSKAAIETATSFLAEKRTHSGGKSTQPGQSKRQREPEEVTEAAQELATERIEASRYLAVCNEELEHHEKKKTEYEEKLKLANSPSAPLKGAPLTKKKSQINKKLKSIDKRIKAVNSLIGKEQQNILATVIDEMDEKERKRKKQKTEEVDMLAVSSEDTKMRGKLRVLPKSE
ncbi:hypothetical protein M408DRAFT_30401 [Serendipita vermifera MAFF 305830]|uniref:FCH domain-containing protein n=1 Tax=Serendipita vermifera MAFF 305830 TaxID=933852 RepID=A0A0C3AM62_SERVB|nr:hypothetical protein M408DRAFT_30401 [Serendipita vermifera MAFF 305830]